MILKVFAVYDQKGEVYSNPWYRTTKGLALRDFEASVNDPNHPFCKNPEDFTMFELGDYDDSKGKFTNLSTPISLGLALEFKKQ